MSPCMTSSTLVHQIQAGDEDEDCIFFHFMSLVRFSVLQYHHVAILLLFLFNNHGQELMFIFRAKTFYNLSVRYIIFIKAVNETRDR